MLLQMLSIFTNEENYMMICLPAPNKVSDIFVLFSDKCTYEVHFSERKQAKLVKYSVYCLLAV